MQVTATKGRNVPPFAAVLAATVRAYASGDTSRNTDVGAMLKAVQAPADTVTPGWAQELVPESIAQYITSLSDSVLGQLLANAIKVNADSGIRVPTRLDSVAAAFVGEGQPIPVMAGAFGGPNFRTQKLAIIAAYSQELANVPGAAPLVESILRESVSAGGDAVLLSDAAGTDAAPAGLFAGVTPIAGSADAAADLGKLVAAVPNTIRPTFLMSDLQSIGAAAANIMQGGTVGRAQVIVSGHVPAGTVAYLDAQDLVFSVGDDVEVSRTDEGVIHADDAPAALVDGAGTIGSPITSLWQIGAFGLRMVLPVSWTLRRAGRVALLTGATW